MGLSRADPYLSANPAPDRSRRDGLDPSDEFLARQLRLHLHHGIGYLATPHLVRLAVEDNAAKATVSGGVEQSVVQPGAPRLVE